MIMRGKKTHTMGGRVEKGDACGKKGFLGLAIDPMDDPAEGCA